MFRKDKQKVTDPAKEVKEKNRPKIDFKITPYTPYNRLGLWIQNIWKL